MPKREIYWRRGLGVGSTGRDSCRCPDSGIVTCGARWGLFSPAYLKCLVPCFPCPGEFPSHVSTKNCSWVRNIPKRFRPGHMRCVYCTHISSLSPSEPAHVPSFTSRKPPSPVKNKSANITPCPSPALVVVPFTEKYYILIAPASPKFGKLGVSYLPG